METMEGHGRPWENTACQGPPGTARASGKATTTDGRPQEIRMCQKALGAARTSVKAGDLEREPTGDHGVLETGGRGKGGRQGVRRNEPLKGDLREQREGDHWDHGEETKGTIGVEPLGS